MARHSNTFFFYYPLVAYTFMSGIYVLYIIKFPIFVHVCGTPDSASSHPDCGHLKPAGTLFCDWVQLATQHVGTNHGVCGDAH